jgi:hypothetical protein
LPKLSAELADAPDDIVDRVALSERDVVDDGSVAKPDQALGVRRDLGIVRSKDDRHIPLLAESR